MIKNTSLILAAVFVIMSVTGVVLFVWDTAFGVHLDYMKAVHVLTGIIFIVVGTIHLKLNIKSILPYIK